MRKLSETNVLNKTITLRVDLNVPVENDKVLDDTRIIAIIPTVEYLLAQNTKIILPPFTRKVIILSELHILC